MDTPKLDAEERADKIMDMVFGLPLGTTIGEAKEYLAKELSEAIKQAEAEAYEREWEESIKRLDGIKAEGYSMGFKDAIEKAAKIPEQDEALLDVQSVGIAEKIRQLKPEGK